MKSAIDGFKKRPSTNGPAAVKRWTFDEQVAQSFPVEARTNIPDYDRVIELTVDIASAFVPKQATIIDVGCALGETLKRLSEAGFISVYGTDSSAEMLGRAYRGANDSVHYIHTDALPVRAGCAKLISANWVLHFVTNRVEFLREIHRSLAVGGLFVMTDRVLQSHNTARLYRQFKLEQGLTEDYIIHKEQALQGVLVSYPLDWYLETLRGIGFREIEIVNASLGFTTFLAKK